MEEEGVGGFDPWQQTSRWHWRYWFGWRVRRWDWRGCYHPVDGQWRYTTHRQHAMAILEEQANGRSENITAGEIDRRINSGRKHSPHWYA